MKASLIDAASETMGNFCIAGHTSIIEKEGVLSALVAGDCTANLINRGAEYAMIDVISAGSAIGPAVLSEGSSRAGITSVIERVAGNAGDNELRAGQAGVGHQKIIGCTLSAGNRGASLIVSLADRAPGDKSVAGTANSSTCLSVESNRAGIAGVVEGVASIARSDELAAGETGVERQEETD